MNSNFSIFSQDFFGLIFDVYETAFLRIGSYAPADDVHLTNVLCICDVVIFILSQTGKIGICLVFVEVSI